MITMPKGNPKVTDDQIIAALKASGGIYGPATEWLKKKTGRHLAHSYLSGRVNKSSKLKKARDGIIEMNLDVAEVYLFDLIKQKKFNAIKFYLERKGRHRGWGLKIENTGPDGGPIEIKGKINLVDTAARFSDAIRQRHEDNE